MPTTSDPHVTKTSLDYIAEGYWQDFLAKRPIAGGIAYESQLHACDLDESLASLQRLDTLLSQIRRDIIKNGKTSDIAIDNSRAGEEQWLTDERFRHLLWFIAFYAGRVLAVHWQSVAHWYSQSELRRRHPELNVNADDFYQEMAVVYRSAADANQYTDDKEAAQATSGLFFALEPIGLRLFGNIDRQFTAVQGGSVASGLYQAVTERLPNTDKPVITSQTLSPVSMSEQTQVTQVNQVTSEPNEPVAQKPVAVKARLPIDNSVSTQSSAPQSITAQNNNSAIEATTETSHQPQDVPKNPNKTLQPTPQPTPELFTRLLTELTEIKVAQSAGVAEYQQACKILDQFERHIAKQAKPRQQVRFSATHQAARQQALALLTTAANKGHTAAMLRLAMYELLGEGLTNAHTDVNSDTVTDVNTDAIDNSSQAELTDSQGVAWVKQAANSKDSRAQRLLSKLYYQGFGLEQDMAMGKYWLEQAAENGHPEAIVIDREWQQAQLLMSTKAQEQHSLKRYQLLITVIIVAALLLIILV